MRRTGDSPTLAGLALRGIRFHWRTNLSVFFGVGIAAAVLIGALLVGDSVRYSLRRFALLRLGDTTLAMDTRTRFFAPPLAKALGEELGEPVAAVLRLRGIAACHDRTSGAGRQLNRVQVLGAGPQFWRLSRGADPQLDRFETAVSRKVATALNVTVGDEISLRVGKPGLMPRDAPLSSRRAKLSGQGLLTVKSIVSDEELGRFSLAATQIAPYNVFVNPEWLRAKADLDNRANVLLVGGGDSEAMSEEQARAALAKVWRLEHAGISIRALPKQNMLLLESDRVFLDPAISRAATAAQPGAVGVLTYLVNSISRQDGDGTKMTPYSFMVAASPSADRALSPVPEDMRDDQVIINRWLADRLAARVGDTLTVNYFELAAGGKFIEKSRSLSVRAVSEMAALDDERELVPRFAGLTDVERCAQWDIGMPMREELLADKDNEAYWAAYRQTPKAFVTLSAGQDMWGNRFGDLSAVRYAYSAGGAPELLEKLRRTIDPAGIGFFFLPVREQSLKAVAEGLDFGELFIGMSFFLIVAALMLTGLLFVFGVQQRSREMGALLAVGYSPWRVRMLFLSEGAVVAAAGCLLGAVLGTQFTRLMIAGLSTYWKGAIAGAAIRFHAEGATIAEGAIAAFGCAVLALAISMWHQSRRTAHELLRASILDAAMAGGSKLPGRRIGLAVSVACLAGAVGLVINVMMVETANVVAGFFGAGSLLLVAGLGFCRHLLLILGWTATGPQAEGCTASLSPVTLGVRNAARRRNRSLTAVGLLACGSFMVLSVSSMKEDVRAHARERWSGTGGFALFGETTIPVPDDLGTQRGREAFKLDRDTGMEGVEILSLKVHDGDDASCFNLNRAQAPVLLGVDPTAFAERGAFLRPDAKDSLWSLLGMHLPDGSVPALVGDSDTAAWGLGKATGVVQGGLIAYRDERGNMFNVKLVGKLPMRLSVFQGAILISAAAFNERYPSEEGYRMLLADVPPGREEDVSAVLSKQLARVGLNVTPTAERLAEFYSVESTYLGMFLVLGGLGLLLGTVGLGVVVMRNVLERRGELAILKCVGFSMAEVARVVTAEHWLLVGAGLVVGVASSAAAMWPSLHAPGVEVPYAGLGGILLGILCVGLLWTAAAARLALRGSLVAALRNE